MTFTADPGVDAYIDSLPPNRGAAADSGADSRADGPTSELVVNGS